MRIEAEGLGKTFGDKVAVQNLNIKIEPGKIIGLLGPNGAGKTTTVRILSGQIEPDEGTLWINGRKYPALPPRLRAEVGVMPQDVVVWDDLTVKENLIFSAQLQGLNNRRSKARAKELLLDLHLSAEAKVLARHLSGGYRRRLSMANSIVHNPRVIFLDEPTPGVDAQTRLFLRSYIKSLSATHERAVILTDHYIEEVEELSDYVIIIDQGKVIADGTVSEIKNKYGAEGILMVEIDPQKTGPQLQAALEHLGRLHTNVKSYEKMIVAHTANNPKVISKSLDIMNKHNLNPGTVSLKETTLEDIFLSLTGREIRE